MRERARDERRRGLPVTPRSRPDAPRTAVARVHTPRVLFGRYSRGMRDRLPSQVFIQSAPSFVRMLEATRAEQPEQQQAANAAALGAGVGGERTSEAPDAFVFAVDSSGAPLLRNGQPQAPTKLRTAELERSANSANFSAREHVERMWAASDNRFDYRLGRAKRHADAKRRDPDAPPKARARRAWRPARAPSHATRRAPASRVAGGGAEFPRCAHASRARRGRARRRRGTRREVVSRRRHRRRHRRCASRAPSPPGVPGACCRACAPPRRVACRPTRYERRCTTPRPPARPNAYAARAEPAPRALPLLLRRLRGSNYHLPHTAGAPALPRTR